MPGLKLVSLDDDEAEKPAPEETPPEAPPDVAPELAPGVTMLDPTVVEAPPTPPRRGLALADLDAAPVDASGSTRRPPGIGSSALDALVGLGEGATFNHGAEVGEIGSWLGTKLADLTLPSLTRTTESGEPLEPEYVGRRGADPRELVEQSQETLAGKAGKVGGLVASSVALPGVVGAASAPARGLGALRAGANAAQSVGLQAATGAASGALAAGGDSGHDPLAMLAGGATGGALGAAGGAAAKRVSGPAMLNGVPTTGSYADQLMAQIAGLAPKAGTGAGFGALAAGQSSGWDAGKMAKGAASGVLASSLLGKAGLAAPYAAPALRTAGQAAAPFGGIAAGYVPKASAQDAKAYGTAPTMHWAVKSVLTTGDTGLPPADEQRLTAAVVSGDEDKVISANFALSQKYPAYAARLQRELEALQED